MFKKIKKFFIRKMSAKELHSDEKSLLNEVYGKCTQYASHYDQLNLVDELSKEEVMIAMNE